jgi:Ca-activated chloride channel family protein
MTLRLLISLSLAALAGQSARGQPADDYFHGGAQAYITNNVVFARTEVDAGLKRYPDDEKLKKLDELLKQQQNSQNGQSQQNQSQNQDKNSQSQQNQSKAQQQNQSQQQQQQAKNNDQQNRDKPKQDQQSQSQDRQNQQAGADKESGSTNLEAYAAAEMSEKEAKQLLDSEKNEELLLPVSRNNQPTANQRAPLHDW